MYLTIYCRLNSVLTVDSNKSDNYDTVGLQAYTHMLTLEVVFTSVTQLKQISLSQ